MNLLLFVLFVPSSEAQEKVVFFFCYASRKKKTKKKMKKQKIILCINIFLLFQIKNKKQKSPSLGLMW